MSEENKIGGAVLLVIWIAALAISLVAFYGLDHLIMNMQGLPLNADLTPAG